MFQRYITYPPQDDWLGLERVPFRSAWDNMEIGKWGGAPDRGAVRRRCERQRLDAGGETGRAVRRIYRIVG